MIVSRSAAYQAKKMPLNSAIFFAFQYLLAIVSFSVVADTCNLTCETAPCYAEADLAAACLSSIAYNETWASATLDVLEQSLENYGFLDLYFDTGPPYSISIDIMGELALTKAQMPFDKDWSFQERVQDILTKPLDAHTRYKKPNCYNVTFVLPFAFNLSVLPSGASQEPKLFLASGVFADAYARLYPDINFSIVLGQQITLIGGVEFTTAISSWGDTHETRSNHPSARFNAAVRSFLYRSAISVKVADMVDSANHVLPLNLTLANGSIHSFPWLAMYSSALGNVNACELQPSSTTNESSTAGTLLSREESPRRRRSRPQFEFEAAPSLDEATLVTGRDARPIPAEIVPILSRRRLSSVHEVIGGRRIVILSSSNTTISCFVQDTTQLPGSDSAHVGAALVMKVGSFFPPGEYEDVIAAFLADAATCLSTPHDLLVIDVMQNGGGIVCLGIRLLEMVFQDYAEDHTKVQMTYDLPQSSLMAAFIAANPSLTGPTVDPEEKTILDPITQAPFPNGNAYYYPGRNLTQGGRLSRRTNAFVNDCRNEEALPVANFKPAKWLDPAHIIILTDGTCGSTCASFTKIPQEAGLATFVGAGGLWLEPMDVSSFAGGFVANPDVLHQFVNATDSALEPFPRFITSQTWQFDWAVWYSALLPSRPVQFTSQEPDFRVPFWSFPHISVDSVSTTVAVSSLYDSIISSAVDRLAVNAELHPDSGSSGAETGLTIGLVFTVLAAALGWLLLRRERYGKSVKGNHVQQPEGPYYRDASPSGSYVSVENPFSK